MRQARLLRIARGGMAHSWGFLVAAGLACAVAASPPPAAAGEKYALLIGLDDYGPGKAQGITRLGYASRDVRDMEQALTALGYKYLERPLLNQVARRLDIVRALSYHAETLTQEDTFVLFFAGHGVRAGNGHTYWLTRDTSLSLLDDNGIRLEHLLDYVRDIKASKKLVLLDHCFSGDVTPVVGRSPNLDSTSPAGAGNRAAGSAEGGAVLTRGISRVSDIGEEIRSRGRGLIVVAAARDEAFESDKLQHGVFTAALLDALRSHKASQDESLSALELLRFVGGRVRELARELKLPDQGVYDVVEGTAIADWEIGKPTGGDVQDYVRTLSRWAGREWISLATKMRCKTILEKAARTGASDPGLTSEENELLQEIRKHMQFPEGDEESWAKDLEQELSPSP